MPITTAGGTDDGTPQRNLKNLKMKNMLEILDNYLESVVKDALFNLKNLIGVDTTRQIKKM